MPRITGQLMYPWKSVTGESKFTTLNFEHQNREIFVSSWFFYHLPRGSLELAFSSFSLSYHPLGFFSLSYFKQSKKVVHHCRSIETTYRQAWVYTEIRFPQNRGCESHDRFIFLLEEALFLFSPFISFFLIPFFFNWRSLLT